MPTPEVHLVNLLKANPTQLQEFGGLVRRNRGQVSVYIHPFFAEDTPERAKFRRVPGYEERRRQFFQEFTRRKRPLIIFEQERDAHLLRSRLAEALQPDSILHAYTILTEDESVKPVGGLVLWRKFKYTLLKSGVKNIEVGGLHLELYTPDEIAYKFEHNPDLYKNPLAYAQHLENFQDGNPKSYEWANRGLIPTGCVGNFTLTLSATKRFNVRLLTEISSPTTSLESTFSIWDEYYQPPQRAGAS